MKKKDLIPKVGTLGELYQLALKDERYMRLLITAANNLGGGDCATYANARQWLDMNATESGSEAGVVDEVNFCRDLI